MRYKLEFQKPPSSGRGGGAAQAVGVTMKRETATSKKSSGGVTIRIGGDVMAEMVWQRGDKVQWAIDSDAGVLAIRRVTVKESGYTLSKNGGQKHGGKSCRFRVGRTMFKALSGMPTDELTEVVTAKEDGMLIIALEPGWARI